MALTGLTIAVLALQGAVTEHMHSVERCGASALAVRRAAQLSGVDGLIIPGGESTTIGRLSGLYGFREAICSLAAAGKPVLGTCAGAILLARRVDGQDPIIPLMDIAVVRNAFGRQRESFETDMAIPALGAEPYCGVFIRAPLISSVGAEVEVLASYGAGVVFARQKNLLAVAFHPELTDDLRLHQYFLNMAAANR
ncbi:MAG TPA: pyridoxal 5'-phosphate synthase glutaminase subunit PdxT [Firmicutes bacterium]|nr:pyridoxal 5'-phosphate synthase glutaminase subunit PdxT [Bacillota bacterium]